VIRVKLTPEQIRAIERALEHYRDTHPQFGLLPNPRGNVFYSNMQKLIAHVRDHHDD